MAEGGTWFVSRSGIVWDVARPTVEMIHWPDVAESLAKQCRWNGHCKDFYSVAQHCVMVAKLMPSRLGLEGLLHDAHEAFLGDITRPVKVVLGDALKRIERRLDETIYSAAGIGVPRAAARWNIKDADMVALATERRDIMAQPPAEVNFIPVEHEYRPHPDPIVPQPWEAAKRSWLEHFKLFYAYHHGVEAAENLVQ